MKYEKMGTECLEKNSTKRTENKDLPLQLEKNKATGASGVGTFQGGSDKSNKDRKKG